MRCCFRYLGYTDFEKVARLGWSDFQFMMSVKTEILEDENEKMHIQAWLNRSINSTNKKSEYIYKKFSDFYSKENNKKTKNIGISEEKRNAILLASEKLKKYNEGR